MSNEFPEKIYATRLNNKQGVETIGTICTGFKAHDDDIEYIRADVVEKDLMAVMGDGAGVYIDRQVKEAIKHIRAVYEKYKTYKCENEHKREQKLIYLWQAIKKDLNED